MHYGKSKILKWNFKNTIGIHFVTLKTGCANNLLSAKSTPTILKYHNSPRIQIQQ